MFGTNKQTVGEVGTSAHVNQAGRDIVINNGLQVSDVVPIVKAMVQSELALYQQQAECTAQKRFNDFAQSLESSIAERVADKVERFNEPAMQFAAREAAVGYIKTGSLSDREALIDLLIERVKEKEHSSNQMLIDEAIKILPKLSKESLAILTLLAYRKLLLSRGGFPVLERWFQCISPILEILPTITKLDIACLSQADCVTGIVGIGSNADWVKSLQNDYDVYFRHPISTEDAGLLRDKIGFRNEGNTFFLDNLPNNPNLIASVVQLFSFVDVSSIRLVGINTSTYEEVLNKTGQYELLEEVKNVIKRSQPFTEQEIINKLDSIHPNWSKAIQLFNENPLNGYQLKPVGMYIGGRQLSKLYGQEISMDLFLN